MFWYEKMQNMNENQKNYYDGIIIAIKTNNRYTYFFFSSFADISKIFFYQSKRYIVVYITLSGIDPLLLPNRRIFYFELKIPPKNTPNDTYNIIR